MIKKKTIKRVYTRFPKKELNTWLKERSYWNHDDWLNLLDDLRDSGFEKWTSTQEGQIEIGQYLETMRSQY